MHKILTAIALTAAVAATPVAAQENTQRGLSSEATAALLIGGVALLALAKKKKDDDKKHEVNHRNHYSNHGSFKHSHGGKTHWHKNGISRNSHYHAHNSNKQRSLRAIPRDCIRRVDNGNNDFRYVSRSCLNNSNYSRALPQRCGVFENRNGTPRAYGVRCLRSAGIRFEAR